MNRSHHAAVIGGGITGLTTAYELARAGYQVTVYEQEPHVAMKCSYANGGQLSVSNSEVWTTMSNVKKALGWLGESQAPLLIRPTLDTKLWSWMLKFLSNCTDRTYRENTSQTIQLGLHSRKLYQEIMDRTGIDFDHSASGILHFYKSDQYLKQAAQAKELYDQNNVEWCMLNREQVFQKEPALAGSRDKVDIVGGVWTGSDSMGDIHKFCKNLAMWMKNNMNVRFATNVSVSGWQILHNFKESYGLIVVCAGVDSVEISNYLEDNLDVYPVKGYSITITVPEDQTAFLPKTSLLDDQAKIVTSTLGNRLRVAGTAEFAGKNYDITWDRVKPLLNWVHRHFPKLDTSDFKPWTCLRPMTPNMLPIVKQSKSCPVVWYNTGHGHLGWTLAPATAHLLVKKLQNNK